MADHDMVTALHLAASQGNDKERVDVVKTLVGIKLDNNNETLFKMNG